MRGRETGRGSAPAAVASDRPLEGKVGIVTGASRGIGAATAVGLAEAGAAVSIAARSADLLDELAARMEADGARALAVPTDVGDAESVRRARRAGRRSAPRSRLPPLLRPAPPPSQPRFLCSPR